jgi:diguanylate cyclase (GGDEF)-like protein
MKYTHAAIIEPNEKRWKSIAQGLQKAGLRVSTARAPEELTRENLVVIGATKGSPSRAARLVRRAAPKALVLAARSKGFTAAWADAVLPLPVSPPDLRVRLAEFTANRAMAMIPATRPGEGILDPTTNFYTFAHFKEVLFIEVKRARRYGFPLALALVAFDDLRGAARNDSALAEQLMGGLALAIRRSLRDTDFPVQQATDRVLLLMPHTDLAGSLIVARRICERVSKASLQAGDDVVHPTISVGVAAGAPGREYSFSDLVRQAQEGLDAAIAHGGNRVEFFDPAEARGRAEGPTEEPKVPRIPPVLSALK